MQVNFNLKKPNTVYSPIFICVLSLLCCTHIKAQPDPNTITKKQIPVGQIVLPACKFGLKDTLPHCTATDRNSIAWALAHMAPSCFTILKNHPEVVTNDTVKVRTLKEVVVYSSVITCIRKKITCGYTVISECADLKSVKGTCWVRTTTTNSNLTTKTGIYPNPVNKGGSITISFPFIKNESYSLMITNTSGVTLLNQALPRVNKLSIYPLITNPAWPAGIYFVILLDKENKLLLKEKLVIL